MHRRRQTGAAVAVVVASIGATLADAAPPKLPKVALKTDSACYVAKRYRVVFAGGGFTPQAKYRLKLNGHPLRTGKVNPLGQIEGPTFLAPSVGALAERSFTLSATDGKHTATAHFRTTRMSANFTVPRGSSTGLRTRFRIRGFGPFDSGPKRTIYLHYVRPGGSLRQTVRLGRTRGACGHLTSGARPVFPFAAQPGNWRLQFDTIRAYRRRPRAPFARLTVSVLRARR